MEQIEKVRTPMIYGALAGVIADVGAVAKDKVNKIQGFKFRSIDDVYNALHPALAKNKVVIVPRILERTCEVVGKTAKGTNMIKVVCKIKFNFYAEDGSTVESVIVGEGLDTGDKATNKAMAIAYKYACFQVFCIPTEEMVDPDAECTEKELVNRSSNGKQRASSGKKEPEPVAPAPCPVDTWSDTIDTTVTHIRKGGDTWGGIVKAYYPCLVQEKGLSGAIRALKIV